MRTPNRTVAAALLALLLVSPLSGRAAAVRTEQGLVSGTTTVDPGITLFAGLPYAAAPVGPLRWTPPAPPAAWAGLRKADKFGPHCPQPTVFSGIHFRTEAMSEDCLTLNIWTPAPQAGARLPVYVWIHGGAWVTGAGSEPRYDGAYLAKQGVVVVSLNYRLGVLGFLAHPGLADERNGQTGNYGLMDQIAALRWVKNNIAAFGGDPDQVTAGGESAGSNAVSLLMASTAARGLFQRAIGESGSGIAAGSPTAPHFLADSMAVGQQLSQRAGTDLAGLRALSPDALLKAAAGLSFGPNIDGAVLAEPPSAAFDEGSQARIPLLAGWNRDEGLWFARYFFHLDPSPAAFAARAKANYGKRADQLLSLYPAVSEAEARDATDELTSDTLIDFPTWVWLERQRDTGQARVYRYQFDRQPAVPRHYASPESPKEWGVYHAGELEYVFHTLDGVDAPWDAADRRVSDGMAAAWIRFIKTGDPNGPGLPQWPVYDPADGRTVMHFDAEIKIEPEAELVLKRYRFLDNTVP